MTLLRHLLPDDLAVIAFWSLIQNEQGAASKYTLRRFSDLTSKASMFVLRRPEEAAAHIPASALRVQRANGDQKSMIDAWVEVAPGMRALLLTDPTFQELRVPI